jgi:serine phosphatase RsbU (regulator of sigma subunit)/anti-sigma regulatory factor (Ser/Thr protein kinase)
MSTRLSNALSRADVAEIVLDETGRGVGADGGALAVMTDRQILKTIAWRGYADEVVESWLELPVDVRAPSTRALRRRAAAHYETLEELRREFPDVAEGLARTGHTSFLFVPLVAGRDAKGLLALSWAERQPLTADQRGLLETLASQAAQAIDRAEHFEWERTVAETLQRSVLPASLPTVKSVDLAARYLPGTAELEVGGDWFDAIPLTGDRLGLVVGDVVGKGVAAAANMAQLRNALRAFALDRLKPSSAIARLNRLANESLETPFATVVYAIVDPQSGICRFTSAGHPPPVVAYPDGRVEFMDGARSLPLGAATDTHYRQEVVELPAGTLLLLYTDGLVERRDRPLDLGLELLLDSVREAPRDPEGLVEHVLDRLVGEGERGDDIALMAARLLPVAPRPLHLSLPLEMESLRVARDSLRAWLDGVPLAESAAHDVVLAAWEACANAVEHGGLGGGTTLVLDGQIAKTKLRLRVEDDGLWREPTDRPDRGLGLKLMRSLVPSVDVSTAGTGTTVILELPLTDVRSEEPDQQQNDQDEDENASSDVHVPPLV